MRTGNTDEGTHSWAGQSPGMIGLGGSNPDVYGQWTGSEASAAALGAAEEDNENPFWLHDNPAAGGSGGSSPSESVAVSNNNTAGLYLGLLQQIFGYYEDDDNKKLNNFNVIDNGTIIEVPRNQTPAINKNLDTVMENATIVGFPGPNKIGRAHV